MKFLCVGGQWPPQLVCWMETWGVRCRLRPAQPMVCPSIGLPSGRAPAPSHRDQEDPGFLSVAFGVGHRVENGIHGFIFWEGLCSSLFLRASASACWTKGSSPRHWSRGIFFNETFKLWVWSKWSNCPLHSQQLYVYENDFFRRSLSLHWVTKYHSLANLDSRHYSSSFWSSVWDKGVAWQGFGEGSLPGFHTAMCDHMTSWRQRKRKRNSWVSLLIIKLIPWGPNKMTSPKPIHCPKPHLQTPCIGGFGFIIWIGEDIMQPIASPNGVIVAMLASNFTIVAELWSKRLTCRVYLKHKKDYVAVHSMMEQMAINWNPLSHSLHPFSHTPTPALTPPATPTLGFSKKRSQEKVFVSGIQWKMESNSQDVYDVNILLYFLLYCLSLQ